MKIIKWKEILISLFFIFFFSSCDDFNDKKEVTSGTAQDYASVFSKTCSEGSIHIKAIKVAETGTGVTTSVNGDNLKIGDKVQISGTVNTSLCGVSGSLSFSCEGVVYIDTNRSFTCQSGTISSVLPSLSSSSGIGGAIYQPYTMNHGEVWIYENGTAVSTSLSISKASYLNDGCHVSFTCK